MDLSFSKIRFPFCHKIQLRHEHTLQMGNTIGDLCSQALEESQATTKPQMNPDSLTGLNCSATVSLL